MNDPQTQYRETQILTASPEKLLMMLYDAAILSLEEAVDELRKEEKRYDKVNVHLLKAQEVVGELMSTLNLEKGGEIAVNLQSLYAYFLQKIMKGNLEKTEKPLIEVLKFMKELRDGWKIAIAAAQASPDMKKPITKAEIKKPLSGHHHHHQDLPPSSSFNISG